MRIGVVGLGYWGSKHARVLSGLSEVSQVVGVDQREDRRTAMEPPRHKPMSRWPPRPSKQESTSWWRSRWRCAPLMAPG